MKRARYLFGTAMAVAVVMGMYGIQGVHAKSEKEYVPKAKVTTLVQGLLAGIEGMALIADLDAHLLDRGAGLEGMTATTGHGALDVIGVDVLLHGRLPKSRQAAVSGRKAALSTGEAK